MTTLRTTVMMKTDIRGSTIRVPTGETSIFVTGQVRQDLVGTPWEEPLQPLGVQLTSPQLAEIDIYRLR